MPTNRFTEAVREECVDHILEAGNLIGDVIKTLRHSHFDDIPTYHMDTEPKPGAEVFVDAIEALKVVNALKDSLGVIHVEYIETEQHEEISESETDSSTDDDIPF